MAYYLFTADTDLTTKGKKVLAWHVEETAGAAARVYLRNGSVTGDIVIPIRLAASDSKGGSYTPYGTANIFPQGVFVDVVSGAVQGSVDIV